MAITLPEEKMVQLRMWAIDTVLTHRAEGDHTASTTIRDAEKFVKFVLGES